MAYFLSANRYCSVCLLTTFLFTSVTAPYLHAQDNVVIEKNVFAYKRILDLVEKVKKCKKKLNAKNALEYMLEMKDEVEQLTQTQVHLDNCFHKALNDLKKEGVKIDKNHVKSLWNKISSKHLKHLEDLENLNTTIMYDCDELFFKGKDKDKEYSEVPVQFELGVTIALCGILIGIIPHPITKAAGAALFCIGSALAGEPVVDRLKEDQKERMDNYRQKGIC